MSVNPTRTSGARKRTALAASVAAFAVLLTGCGGTRVSDEAVEQAAGVGQVIPLGAATDATTDATTGAASAAAPGAVAPSATDTTAGTGAAGTNTGTGAAATGSQADPKGKTQTNATGGTPAAAGGITAQGPANKPVIRVGAVGTLSGPVGSLVKDVVTGIRVWSQWINARGGVNGHPVEVLAGDDAGDPARYASIQQQFVEQKGAVAFLFGTLGFAPNGNNKYLDSKKIFTLGSEGGLDTAYNNPYVLTATPTGRVNADSILYALSDAARPLGKKKFAAFSCSDFGLCDGLDERWSNPEALKAVGFELVARGRPSLTQPDYTSQCLAAKQAGAEVVMLAMDTPSIRRFAGDCARQNYRPIFGTGDLLALPSLPSDPNVDGMIIAAKMAPWTDLSVPGIAKVTQAFAQYAPGSPPTGAHANGWIVGRFFESIGKNFPAGEVTPADVEAGVYAMKNDNLDGMTFPITMTKGQPMKRQLCYGVVIIKDAKYNRFPGKALRCADPLPGTSGAVERSNVQSAIQPAAQSAGQSAMLPELESSGMPSGRFAMTRVPVKAILPSRPVGEVACGPARVVGISYLLDAFQTGSSAGPGVFYGIALAVIGTPLPEPFAKYQGQFIGEGGSFVEQFSSDGPAAIQESRNVFAPGAAFNEGGNAFIDGMAGGLETGADTFGPFIQPGDRSMREFAASMRDAKVTEESC